MQVAIRIETASQNQSTQAQLLHSKVRFVGKITHKLAVYNISKVVNHNCNRKVVLCPSKTKEISHFGG